MSPRVKQLAWWSGVVLMVALVMAATAPRGLALQSQPTDPAITRPPVSTPDRATAPYGERRAGAEPSPGMSRQAEIPPMYQVTEGPQGVPAAKSCEGCFELLATAGGAAGPESLAPLPQVTGTDSGWQTLETQGFEDAWPWSGSCQILYDGSDDGLDRTWGSGDLRPHTGVRAAWPAAGGADRIDLQSPLNHPDNLNSWLICGPFDLSEASSAYASFWLWSLVEEGHDEFFFGVGDGTNDWFYGLSWDVPVLDWTEYMVYFPSLTGSPAHDSMWLAWNFESDAGSPAGYEGSWLDDLEIARSLPCPTVDPGIKGLHVHRDELPGQVERIADAGTDWVRLEFQMEPDGSLDLGRYANIVDSLCNHDISVIGLVDYTTIPPDLDGDGQEDWNDPEDYIQYQQLFTETVENLSLYFQGSIHHWEIWNEENGATWHIRPEYYARLLVKVSEAVKAVDPDNQILFGGLDHVWVTSQYLEPVYDALDQDWGGARPFDILAVHPYFIRVDGEFILDPNVYLWDRSDPSQTILDTYLDYMALRGDGDKDIWITELGWNSALDNPAIANCPGMRPWCVGRSVQAQYLGDSFDILFNEVEDPQGNHDRVKTIIWYQYNDTSSTVEEMARRMSIDPATLAPDPEMLCPADWGIVDGNKEPKFAYWAFQTYPRRPLEAASDSPTLLGSPTTLTATFTITPSDGFAYTWAFGDGDYDHGPEVAHTYPYPGVYTAVVTASKNITDWLVATTTVTVEEVITELIAINDSPTLLGSPTTLTATLTFTPSSGFTYTWAFGDGDYDQGPEVTHTYPYAGVYTAVVTASKNISDWLVAATMVSVEEVITGLIATSDSPTPLGDFTTLTATITAGSHPSFIWSFGDGTGTAGSVVTHTYTAPAVYTAVVTASNGVSALTATTAVEVTWDPQAHLYLPLVLRQFP